MAPKAPPRRISRSLAFQVLYGQEFGPSTTLRELERAFLNAPRTGDDETDTASSSASAEEGTVNAAASGFAWELVQGVWQRAAELDAIIARFARNWRLERVGRVELTLMRLAIFEMMYRPDVPAKVAMNEALDLNKQFGEEKSRTFVNGILDAANKAMENGELTRKNGSLS